MTSFDFDNELMDMVPFSIGISPRIPLINVVLPEPFSPTRNVSECRGTQQEASQRISFESRMTVKFSHSTMFSEGK